MFPRVALALFSLLALVAATPIDPGLQPIIAAKNNLGLVNPPTTNSNAASGRALVSGAGTAIAMGVVAVLI
ncbi:hypothetical protein DFH07DRAFT_953335 [Mycena maculata]|uniref:Uncharacterized protein n=1 Tax=Mycena maculata TaxID=230809 RepID=A0AAD7JWY7_9AGAR|nr:hypothetical protein DFH07DRAFT_953335 [Mycena maculata]